LCEELRPLAAELLAPGRLRRQGLFDARHVQRLLEAHWARRANYRKQLWTLLMFQLWWEHYGGGLCDVLPVPTHQFQTALAYGQATPHQATMQAAPCVQRPYHDP